uniref:Serine/threonine protein kinase n=1 Tax=Mesocestoides corti TaxID=53468 RepID=A0A5K3FRB1_MESCO
CDPGTVSIEYNDERVAAAEPPAAAGSRGGLQASEPAFDRPSGGAPRPTPQAHHHSTVPSVWPQPAPSSADIRPSTALTDTPP